MRRLAAASLGLGLGLGFYLLLIDTAVPAELCAAAGVALPAAFAFELAREQGFAEASFPARSLLRVPGVLAGVPVAIWHVSLEAVMQLLSPASPRGHWRAIPFGAGDGEHPRDRGRRALVEAAGSLAPSTIVVGIDTDRDLLLVHELRRRSGRSGADPLGLG